MKMFLKRVQHSVHNLIKTYVRLIDFYHLFFRNIMYHIITFIFERNYKAVSK